MIDPTGTVKNACLGTSLSTTKEEITRKRTRLSTIRGSALEEQQYPGTSSTPLNRGPFVSTAITERAPSSGCSIIDRLIFFRSSIINCTFRMTKRFSNLDDFGPGFVDPGGMFNDIPATSYFRGLSLCPHHLPALEPRARSWKSKSAIPVRGEIILA